MNVDDDGIDRGLMFVFIGADLKRQFEFVQATWLNDGEFIGAGRRSDAVSGTRENPQDLVIP